MYLFEHSHLLSLGIMVTARPALAGKFECLRLIGL